MVLIKSCFILRDRYRYEILQVPKSIRIRFKDIMKLHNTRLVFHLPFFILQCYAWNHASIYILFPLYSDFS